jgi:hypothetical protein
MQAKSAYKTAVENLKLGIKLSEYHTGDLAFSRRELETLPLKILSLVSRLWRELMLWAAVRQRARRVLVFLRQGDCCPWWRARVFK